MIRRCVALAIALFCVAAMTGVTQAQPLELGVGPAFEDLSVDPANAVEETVNVVNLSDVDLDVVGAITDLAVNSSGTFSSVELGAGLPSAASWATAEPSSFKLPRGHVRMVKLTFRPPANTTPGGFYAAARFVGTTSGGASTRSIHAVLLEVRGTGVLRAGKVAGISVPTASFGSTLPVKVRLASTGNVYAIATGRVIVRDMRSNVTAAVTINKTPVIPGTERVLQLSLPAPAFPGRVRVSADIEFGPGVPKDSATTSVYAFAWWHLVSAVIVLFVLARLVLAFFRWRRGRRLMKPRKVKREAPMETAPATVEDLDLQAEWERSREAAPSARRKATAVVAAPPAAAPSPPAIVEDGEDFWAPKSNVHTPLEVPGEEEPETAPAARASASVPKLADLIALQRPAAEEEPEDEPEAEEEDIEPEPDEAPAPAVVVPIVPAASQPQPPGAPEEEPEQPAARVHQLSEVVRAGVPMTRPSGPQAARRRVKVAVDMLATGSGRSSERLDIAVQLLASAGGDVVGAVEDSFDSAAAVGRAGAMGSLALALALLDSPRAPEALLRAYAVAPRSNAPALREALKACDPEVVKEQQALLDALPQDRRSSLKLA